MASTGSSSRLLTSIRNVKCTATRSRRPPSAPSHRCISSGVLGRVPLSAHSSRTTIHSKDHIKPSSTSPYFASPFSSNAPSRESLREQEEDLTELSPPSSSSTPGSHPSNSYISKNSAKYLSELLPPLDFPPELAQRILTHSSYRAAAQTEGHNTRLGFMGRRVLKGYFMLFLQSAESRINASSAAGSESDGAAWEEVDYEELTEKVLDTHVLGQYVGGPWQVERVMRWTSARNGVDRDPSAVMAGLRKVRGATVEAVIGGIFHQFGGVAAHIAFHTRVLPHLIPVLPSYLGETVEDVCYSLGGRNAPLLPDPSSTPISPRDSVLVQGQSPRGPTRRVASA